MPPAGRVGDTAQIQADKHGCPACPHPGIGPAIAGSPDVYVNSLPALRVGDKGIHAACCGPNMWTANAGSSGVYINSKQAHRKDDATTHCGGDGKLTVGSGDVYIGDGGGGGSAPGSATARAEDRQAQAAEAAEEAEVEAGETTGGTSGGSTGSLGADQGEAPAAEEFAPGTDVGGEGELGPSPEPWTSEEGEPGEETAPAGEEAAEGEEAPSALEPEPAAPEAPPEGETPPPEPAAGQESVIEIHVVDSKGQPARNVYYQVQLAEGPPRTGFTDDQGVIRLNVAPQTGNFIVRLPEYEPGGGDQGGSSPPVGD